MQRFRSHRGAELMLRLLLLLVLVLFVLVLELIGVVGVAPTTQHPAPRDYGIRRDSDYPAPQHLSTQHPAPREDGIRRHAVKQTLRHPREPLQSKL